MAVALACRTAAPAPLRCCLTRQRPSSARLPFPRPQAALHAAKADKGAVARAAKKADAMLRALVDITLRTDLTRTQRTNLETCITVHMHQKEVG